MSNFSRTVCFTGTLILSLLFYMPAACAQDSGLRAALQRTLSAHRVPLDHVGVAVMDVESKKTLAAINGSLPLNPASCTKVFTAGAALAALGPDHRFHTLIATDARTNNGTIHDLYLYGDGDPFLVSEELEKIVAQLKAQGLRRITGNVIVDGSFFGQNTYPRKGGDEGRAFTADISAVALNFNSITFEISSSKGKPRVTVLPDTPYARVVNQMRVGKKYAVWVQSKPSAASETFFIRGTVPANMRPQMIYRRIASPEQYMGQTLISLLQQQGIDVTGSVQTGRMPKNSIVLLDHASKPLVMIVSDMNKFSNNFIAEQLLMHLGAQRFGAPATTAKGVNAVRDYVRLLGLSTDQLTLENGSGLSARNRMTAQLLAAVLTAAQHDFPDFADTLAVFGVDGTMKRWSGYTNLHGKVRAKTGSLDGVSTLAGFVPRSNGRMAAFAIMMNGSGSYSPQNVQMSLVEVMSKY